MTDTTPQHRDATGANWRDAYLCYCEEVTDAEFRAQIAMRPDISFEQLCAETGVASKCTACLLNAEYIFIGAERGDAGGSATDVGAGRRPRGRWNRRRLYRLVDSLSPRFARRVPGIIPVIRGEGISTVVAFANTVPPVIGSRAPDFEVKVRVHDAEGRLVSMDRGRVESGGRLEFDISRALPRAAEGGLYSGACFLSYRALGRGYLGGIRPHYMVVTAGAVGAVHSAAGGREEAFMETCFLNPDERQYISVVNAFDRPARVTLETTGEEGAVPFAEDTVPARGARLIAVPAGDPARDRPFGVLAKSDRPLRWHYLVCEGRPPRISLDHI